MKKLLTLLFCLIPLVGICQTSMPKDYTYPVEVYKIANANLEKENKRLKESVALYEVLTYEQDKVIKLLNEKVALLKRVPIKEKTISKDTIIWPQKMRTANGDWYRLIIIGEDVKAQKVSKGVRPYGYVKE